MSSKIKIYRQSYKLPGSVWLNLVYDEEGKEKALKHIEGEDLQLRDLEVTEVDPSENFGRIYRWMTGDVGRYYTYYIENPKIRKVVDAVHPHRAGSDGDWLVHTDHYGKYDAEPSITTEELSSDFIRFSSYTFIVRIKDSPNLVLHRSFSEYGIEFIPYNFWSFNGSEAEKAQILEQNKIATEQLRKSLVDDFNQLIQKAGPDAKISGLALSGTSNASDWGRDIFFKRIS